MNDPRMEQLDGMLQNDGVKFERRTHPSDNSLHLVIDGGDISVICCAMSRNMIEILASDDSEPTWFRNAEDALVEITRLREHFSE